MDLKGITWVGNIYQKFETMCLEVEEIMYQDTIDLIENHVQTVGASVKKFYSDVVQDLLPPSSLDDSGKKDVSGIDSQEYKDVEIVKKPKVGRKFAERKNVGITPPRNVENVLPMATRITSEIQTSTNDGNLVKENQTSEICELSLRELRMENQVEITEDDDDDAIRSAAENAKRCEEIIADPSWDLAASSQELHMGNNTFCSAERPIDIEDIQYDNGSKEEIDLFNPGEVEDSYMICTDSSCLFEQKETRSCNLEESCIFVDEVEVEFVAVNKGKHRQHKKTLREAFSPRKRSWRAQEYKQLAAKYSDEEQPAQSSGTALRLEEGGDSEWEIL